MSEEKSQISISTVVQISSASLLAFYVLGFTVVNSYLIKLGLYSFDVLNSQYLAAGIIFAVAAGIFGFVVGRRIYFIERDFTEFALLATKFRFQKIWVLFCFVYVFVELAFAGVVGAFWTAGLLFEDIQGHNNLLIGISAVFLIDYLILFRRKIYKNYPQVAIPIAFIGFITIIIVAVKLVPDPRMYTLYVYYFLTGIILNIVIDVSHRRVPSILFNAFWGIVTLLTVAALFGSTFYGEVKRQYGGGKPLSAQFVVCREFPEYLANLLKVENSLTAEANILAETNSEFLVQTKAKNSDAQVSLRITKSLVKAVIPTRSKK